MSRREEAVGAALATLAVGLVGGSVAAASVASTYPVLGGQAVRLLVACLLLLAWARATGQPPRRPAAREWGWVIALGTVGMAGYGIVLIHATAVTDPANVGIAIGAAPLIIVLIREKSPSADVPWRLVLAALVVAVATFLAESTGASISVDLGGLVWSSVAMGGVASITLLAAPIVDTLGSLSVTVYATGVAGTSLLLTAVVHGMATGEIVLRCPTLKEFGGLAYLTIAVTAIVYLLWYAAVRRLGASRAGLFNGLIPLTSVVAVAAVGGGAITWTRLGCSTLVMVGVLLGLTAKRTR